MGIKVVTLELAVRDYEAENIIKEIENDLKIRSSITELPYTYQITPSEEGFFIKVLELEGCISQGDSINECFHNIEQAMILWLKEALEQGIEIPAPKSESDKCDNCKKLQEKIDRIEGFIKSGRVRVKQKHSPCFGCGSYDTEKDKCKMGHYLGCPHIRDTL